MKRSSVPQIRMLMAAIMVANILSGSGLINVGSVQKVYAATQWDTGSDTWVATDDLGRSLPTYSDVGAARSNKTVGVFYPIWNGSVDSETDNAIIQGVPGPVYYDVHDVNQILANNPGAIENDNNSIWGPFSMHFWGQPLFGYHKSDDRYVIRKYAQMLSDAGVDTIILDASNYDMFQRYPQNSIRNYTYLTAYLALFDEYKKIRDNGGKTPQVMFMCSFSTSVDALELRQLYADFYGNSTYNTLYGDLFFKWLGKPLIMADPSSLSTNSTDTAIKNYFTFRKPQPTQGQPIDPGYWGWLSNYPQPMFNGEEMCVSVGQNTRDLGGEVGMYSVMRDASGNFLGRGRSFNNGYEPQSSDPLSSVYAPNYGMNFSEQWEHAISADPQFIFVDGWNEWLVGKFRNLNIGDVSSYPHQYNEFCDQFNTEFSRDAAPMIGGYGDNYYYQMCNYIRKYKGVSAPPAISESQTISIDGSFSEWTNVAPEFRDDMGDSSNRNHPGYDARVTLTNNTWRSDFKLTKVARDINNIYFYVQTVNNISDSNGMRLFFKTTTTDPNWKGYNYVVNLSGISNTVTNLQKSTGGWNWTTVNSSIQYRVSGNQVELAIPRSSIGLSNTSVPINVEFKWHDNMQTLGDVNEFYLNGDAAPNERFNYLYSEGQSSQGGSDLLNDNFNSGSYKLWENFSSYTPIQNGTLTVSNTQTLQSNVAGDKNWTNYAIEADLKITNNSTGLVFRKKNDDNYYYWQFNVNANSDGGLIPHVKVSGKWIDYSRVAYNIQLNTQYHIKIEVNGSVIKTYITDMTNPIDVRMNSLVSSGKVGFKCSGVTESGVIDNYRVYTLTDTLPTPTPSVADIIIDNNNGSPDFTTSTPAPDFYNGTGELDPMYGNPASEYLSAAGSTSDKYCKFTPNIQTAGKYNVYGWWTHNTNRAVDAPYTVCFNNNGDIVNQMVKVDQTQNGGKWVYLGTWNFAAGRSGYVMISNATNGYVMMDAVKFEYVSPAAMQAATNLYNGTGSYTPVQLNGGKAAERFRSTEPFNSIDVCCPNFANPVNKVTLKLYKWSNDYSSTTSISQYLIASMDFVNYTDNAYLKLDFPIQPAGNYLWELSSPSGLASVYRVASSDNQENIAYFNGSISGVTGDYVSRIYYTPATVTPTPTPVPEIVIDNNSSSFQLTGAAWSNSDQNAESDPMYGSPASEYGCGNGSTPGNGSVYGKYTPNILTEGDYNVFVWYTANSNRYSKANYTVCYNKAAGDAGACQTVTKDQRSAGGQWTFLGRWHFKQGTLQYVLISDYFKNDGSVDNGYIMMDAVKFVYYSPGSTQTPTNLYSNNTSPEAVSLIPGTKDTVGEKFSAISDFNSIDIYCPNLANQSAKKMTFKLYEWKGTYADTINSGPIDITLQYSSCDSVFNHDVKIIKDIIDYQDNSMVRFVFPSLQGGKDYLWQLSDPYSASVGAWVYRGSSSSNTAAYENGIQVTGDFASRIYYN